MAKWLPLVEYQAWSVVFKERTSVWSRVLGARFAPFPISPPWPSSPRAVFAKGLRIQWPRRTCLNTTCLGPLEIIFQEPGSLLPALSPHHRGNCTEIRNGKKKAGPCCQLFLFRYTLKIHILFSPGHQVLPFLPRKVLAESRFDLNFTWFYLSNGNRKLKTLPNLSNFGWLIFGPLSMFLFLPSPHKYWDIVIDWLIAHRKKNVKKMKFTL